MNIVIAAHGFLPSIGGVSTTEAILARSFVEAGHDVTVTTLTPGPLDGYGHAVLRNPHPAKLFELYRKADVLIVSNLAIKLIYPLWFLRRSFALRHHSESAFHLSPSLLSLDALRRAVLPRAKHFVTSDFIGRKSGYPRYVVTHPFSNPHHITPEVVLPPAARSGALFVGRFELEKGVRWLLERWSTIRETLGVDTLRLVGRGALAAEMEAAAQSGAYPGLQFVGPLQRAETAKEMGRAAYIITPSLWEEPFGAVALEGVAAGAISLVSNRGGLPEAAGPLGIYFDPDDEQGFKEALQSARGRFESHLASPSQRQEYETQVAAHVAEFRPEVVMRKILKEMTE
jgi:glycosyltransferase involved in cell wall biosynthesis